MKVFCMILFWFLVWWLGPGWLTAIYLGLTMGVLALIAKFKDETFGSLLANNNWVFFATLAMSILSGVMAYCNPMVPKGIGGWLWDLVSSEKTLVDSAFWGAINDFFFDESFTHRWSDATLTYFLWLIPAFCVSFWDEVKKFLGKLFAHLGKGEGLATFAVKDGLMELFWSIFRKK